MTRMEIRAAVCLASALLVGALSSAEAATGRTAGSFVVTNDGAASYTIPIGVPPGPRGVQPHLALVYNSRQGGGSLGLGWSLSGLSSIYRCNRTLAQDGTSSPVSLSTSDGLCLDGSRLRLQSGTYAVAGSTYQTEVANFSLVTASGAAGNGPASFTVQGKDGLIYEYGNGGNSQVLASGSATAIAWMIDQISDRFGNKMVIAYLPASAALAGTTVPDTIQWTPSAHGSSSYNYQVKFDYGSNVPQSSINAYAAGTPLTNTELLNDIKISSSGTVVKQYVLTYGVSPTTAAKRLTQVLECPNAGATNCLIPTNIIYQDGAAGMVTTATSQLSGAFLAASAHHDFNGDGFADIAYLNNATSTWWVAFGSTAGYGTPFNTGIVGIASSRFLSVLFGDLLGSGKDGILASNVNQNLWTYYTWNGSAFSGSVVASSAVGASGAALADVNGDGLPDLVLMYYSSTASSYTDTFYVLLNTSSTTTASFAAATAALTQSGSLATGANGGIPPSLITPDTQFGPLKSFDFNGDGLDDLAFVQAVCVAFIPNPGGGGSCAAFTTTTYQLISQPNGTFTAPVAASFTTTTSSPPSVFFTNWNNDACTDVVVGSGVLVSGCNGAPVSTIASAAAVVGTIDWDGDGRTDLLLAGSPNLQVQLSTGTGVGTAAPTSIPYSSGCTVMTLDADGDGLDDAGAFCPNGTPGITYFLHNQAGVTPNLLASVADGYGNTASATYTNLARGSSGSTPTYTEGSGAIYPEVDIRDSTLVVSQTSSSDGIGGTYTQTYRYFGARADLTGRGMEGFQARQVIDSRNGLVHKTQFDTKFPTTGMPNTDDVFQSNGTTPVSHATFTNVDTVLDSTANNQRHFPNLSGSNVKSYEVGGVKDGLLITTTAVTYTYDGAGNAYNISQTVTDNDSTAPASPYAGMSWTSTVAMSITPDTSSNWCLNLPTQVQTTRNAPGVASVTRTMHYSPNYANCVETQKQTEPSSGLYEVTEAYGFDAFGNPNSIAVTGIGMSTRTTTIDWGSTGQFPMTVTNPLLQATQYGYDFTQGLRTSATDPNGVATSWHYDPFGRKDRETRPDGTKTAWSYDDCASTACLIGTHAVVVSQTMQNVDNTALSDAKTYFDPLDRPIATTKRLLASGAYDRQDVHYDALGRTHQQGIACAWTTVAAYCSNQITNTYDVEGRMTQSQRPISSTNATLQTTTVAYAGRTTTVTDPQGKQSVTVKTVAGTLGRSQDHAGYYQSFTYDGFGSLLGVTDSVGNSLFSAAYQYGVQAFQTSTTDTDLGSRTQTFNALGEMVSYSDSNGSGGTARNFTMTYDALSRPLIRTEPDLTTTWAWGSTPGSFNVGQLASVSAGAYSEAYTYDGVGRPSTRSITLPDGSYTYTQSYQANTGLPDTFTYPTSTSSYALKLQYTYQNGYLSQVSDFNAPSTVFWSANATDARGNITQETLGNGVVTNRAYDAVTGWVSLIQSGLSSAPAGLQNESYLYDLVGNLTQRQSNNAAFTENFFYDDLYRLDHSTLQNSAGTATNLALTYDATGNITSRSDVAAGGTWTYDPVRKHAVIQAGSVAFTYTYDANGNATSRNGYTISWTSFNHPSAIAASGESVQFAYNQDHLRWSSIYSGPGGTETTYFIGEGMEKVVTAGVNDFRHFIKAAGQTVAIVSRTTTGVNTLHYLREDRQGSIAGIINSDGTSDVKESFSAFGLRRNCCTASGPPTAGMLSRINSVTRHGYTEQTALGSMGLNDMNGRVEDAVTGRFLSADPIIQNPALTQNFNRYAYAQNNPLTYVDPSGFDFCTSQLAYVGDTTTEEPGPDGNPITTLTSHYAPYLVCFPDPPMLPPYSAPPGTVNNGGASGPGSPPAGPPVPEPKAPTINFPKDRDPQKNQKQSCSGSSLRGYWSNVFQNSIDTNRHTHGSVAPTGVGIITAGGVSQTLWGTNAVTAGRYIFSGLRGTTIGAASFTSLETGILVGVTAAANFAASGVAYEGGVAAGSMISAIPTGGGDTVRDSVADLMYDLFGPRSEYDDGPTAPPAAGCGP